MTQSKKIKVLVPGLIILIINLTLQAQRVTPFQSGSYVPLLTSLRDFAPAPQGVYLIGYNYWLTPGSFYDKDGKELSGTNMLIPPGFPDIGGSLVDLYPEATAFMGMYALYYASPKIPEFGNARYSFLMGPSFQMVRYKLDANIAGEDVQYQGGFAGYGDFFLQPVGLSWSFNNRIDLSFYYGLYLPTASYQTGSADNLGVGHITHQLQMPVLAYFNEQSTAILIAPTFENSGWFVDRDVKSGQRLSIEYGISQYVTNWLELEVMNAHNRQVGDDKGEDAWWLGTTFDTRDSKNLVSVGINVWSWAERLQIRFKYVWDYGVQQNVANEYFSFSLFFNPRWLSHQQLE